jgi:paraquat-inducible protein A
MRERIRRKLTFRTPVLGVGPEPGMSNYASELLVCPNCDAVHRTVVLGRHEIAACIACGCVVARHHSLSVDQLLALTVAAALLFLIANSYPLMTIEVGGMHTEATVWGAALLMLHGWAAWPAAVLALSMFILPLLQIALLLWVLAFARFGRRAPGFRGLLVALHRSRPWSMTEVFLLGALVAIVKLSSWVHVTPGIGIWALASLTMLLTILSMVEPRFWWTLMQAHA